MEGAAVLLKVPGKTSGLSNIPWHQDCGLGGHAILCPAVGIGIQLTGSSAETGNLQVVPGSHGQAVHYGWTQRLAEVPYVSIDTEPGDVTIHIQDVMHASPNRPGREAGAPCTSPTYPPALWDHVGPARPTTTWCATAPNRSRDCSKESVRASVGRVCWVRMNSTRPRHSSALSATIVPTTTMSPWVQRRWVRPRWNAGSR